MADGTYQMASPKFARHNLGRFRTSLTGLSRSVAQSRPGAACDRTGLLLDRAAHIADSVDEAALADVFHAFLRCILEVACRFDDALSKVLRLFDDSMAGASNALCEMVAGSSNRSDDVLALVLDARADVADDVTG